MTARSNAFGLSMLTQALAAIAKAYTWQEGLYDAYVEGLRWLENIECLPRHVRSSMDEIIKDLTRRPRLDRLEQVRATVVTLDQERARTIVVRLVLLRWAVVSETHADPVPLFPRIPSHDQGPRGRCRVLKLADYRH